MRIRTMRGPLGSAAGVSLIELMIGMAISVVMMAAIAMAVQTQSRSAVRETARMDMIHNLQLAAARAEKELRMAGYVSGGTTGLYNGAITSADTNSVSIVYDTDDNGTREAITIRMDQAGDAGYDPAHPRLLRVDSAGAILPIGSDISSIQFQYYDGAGTQLPDANVNGASGAQSSRDTIRGIKVTVNATSATPNPATGSHMTDSLTFMITPRNFLL